MVKKVKKNKFVLLHGHGQAGPKSTRSYIRFGTFVSRERAEREARSLRLDGFRIARKGRVMPSKLKGAKGLWFVKSLKGGRK